jgi:NADH-quinone oxidoreductase subunit I
MLYIYDTLRSLAVSMRNALRKPVTVQFPMEIRPRPERLRGSFALQMDDHGEERCVACKSCERVCPSAVITVELERRESPVTGKKRGYAKSFTLDQTACLYCELCVQVCPEDAIVMTRTPLDPAFDRSSLCLNKEQLQENAKSRPISWANASRLSSMQAPAPVAATTKQDEG